MCDNMGDDVVPKAVYDGWMDELKRAFPDQKVWNGIESSQQQDVRARKLQQYGLCVWAKHQARYVIRTDAEKAAMCQFANQVVVFAKGPKGVTSVSLVMQSGHKCLARAFLSLETANRVFVQNYVIFSVLLLVNASPKVDLMLQINFNTRNRSGAANLTVKRGPGIVLRSSMGLGVWST